MTVEVVSVRSYKGRGKALTLIVRISEGQFIDVDAVIEVPDLHKIQRFFHAQQQKLDLRRGRGLTVLGTWQIAEGGSKLVLHIRKVSKDITEVGPVSRWRAEQRRVVTARWNDIRSHPHTKADVRRQLPDLRNSLADRNIVVIGRRNADGGNDLAHRVQPNIRHKLKFTEQAVQGAPNVVAPAIARRLGEVDPDETALVVIVRGGGGAANRLLFDSALIANAITTCEVPVVTALGHTRDTHLADLVAWCSCTTPTDAGTLINSIWHADPVVPTPAHEQDDTNSSRPTSQPAPPFVPTVPDTGSASAPYPSMAPTIPSSVPGRNDPRHGCLTTVAVLFALLVLLVLLVHFFSSSAGTPRDSSSTSAPSSSRVFASPSKNIVCTGTSLAVRCDLDTVYYSMKSVPKQCQGTSNWGHVFVLEGNGGRMSCPKDRHTSGEGTTLAVLGYGHKLVVGNATCASTANYMQCTRGKHGFRVSKEAHKVW